MFFWEQEIEERDDSFRKEEIKLAVSQTCQEMGSELEAVNL